MIQTNTPFPPSAWSCVWALSLALLTLSGCEDDSPPDGPSKSISLLDSLVDAELDCSADALAGELQADHEHLRLLQEEFDEGWEERWTIEPAPKKKSPPAFSPVKDEASAIKLHKDLYAHVARSVNDFRLTARVRVPGGHQELIRAVSIAPLYKPLENDDAVREELSATRSTTDSTARRPGGHARRTKEGPSCGGDARRSR